MGTEYQLQPVQIRFRKMVVLLSDSFTQTNCKKIKYLSFLSPVDQYSTSDGDVSGLALHILSSLEAKGDINPMKVDNLETLLREISRHDLLQIVTDYKKSKEYKDALKEKKRKKKDASDSSDDHACLQDGSHKQQERLRRLYTLLITHVTGMTQVMEIIREELDRRREGKWSKPWRGS